MRRRLSNRPVWSPGADAAAESQLLSGLVTFRRRAAAHAGKQGPFNTPAATQLDLDFARQLQSLRLMNSGSIGEEDSDQGDATAHADADGVTNNLIDISTDMLVMAADGQLGQSLRWQQRQRLQKQQQLMEQQRRHIALSLPLLDGRLNYFLQAGNSPTPESPPTVGAVRTVKQRGRLAYRTSPPDAVKVSPDAEIAFLLRSRTPTRMQLRQRPSASPEEVPRAKVPSVPLPPMPSPLPAVPLKPRPLLAASTGDIHDSSDEGSLIVRGEVAVSVDARAAGTKQEQSNAQIRNHAADPDEDILIRQQQENRPSPRKTQKKQRRKVTGLEMLNKIEATPQPPPPSAPTPPQTPSTTAQLAMQATTDELGTQAIPVTTVITRRKRIVRPLQEVKNLDPESNKKNQHNDNSVSQSCSCQSQTDRKCSQHLMNYGSRQPSSIATTVETQQQRQQTQADEAEAEQFNPFSPRPQRKQKEEQQEQLVPKAQRSSVASSAESPDFLLQKRPVPDQYRTAHRLAQAANQNAQFAAWLREGRDPAGFFSCRTSATGYYSYFPRLPRYDRGLQPFAEFPPPPRPPPQQQQSSKRTPAFLVYGGKNPDNYLPPPILVRVRQPKEKLAKSDGVGRVEKTETTGQ